MDRTCCLNWLRLTLLLAASCGTATAHSESAAPSAQLLWQLVSGDNVRELRGVCQTRCNFDFHDDKTGLTPLLLALKNGHFFLVSYLLAHGADATLPDAWGEPPIVFAVLQQDSRALARLLAAGANPNAVSRTGLPVLHLAIAERNLGHLRLLLAAGAKPNCRDDRGNTALMAALDARSSESVAALLEAGANVAAVNANGVSNQQVAARNGMPALQPNPAK